ncbi:MAG TPA: hypothetical protein VLA75_01685 [Thermoanaerobaculia bacterium]|nr:hypothetical protein [Thermoanaerobaculia bacterium]
MARLPRLRSFVALLVLAPLFAALGEWHVGHGGVHGPHSEAPHTGIAAPGEGAFTAPGEAATAPADCPACLHQLRAGAATLPAVAPLPAYAVALAPEAAPAIASGWRTLRAADARGPPAAG